MTGIRLGSMQNPVRGFLHGTAALVSIVGLLAIISTGSSGAVMATSIIYGLALVGLYTTSSLYHSVPWREMWKARLQRMDHTMIYVLVAATFTPLLVAAVDGPWVAVGLLGIWGLAALGLVKELWPSVRGRPLLVVQFLAGSLCLVPMWLTLISLEASTSLLVLFGGVVYLAGVAMFVRGWPRLAPGIFSHHELFHVMVIVASVAHFAAVWRVVGGG